MIKLSTLKLNEDNPRHISEEKLEALKRSIKGFEKMMSLRPIIVNKQKVILGGNMRYKALIELGYKSVPKEWVKVADELTDEEQREFIIRDNISQGSWDWPTLEADWDLDQLKEWGLEIFEDMDATPIPTPGPSEPKNKIVLEYTDEEHHAITARFNELEGSKEAIVWRLLME